MDFAQQFSDAQTMIRTAKMAMVVKRSMAIQARSKIKPNSMRPSLREMSVLRGGDASAISNLNLYWPGQ